MAFHHTNRVLLTNKFVNGILSHPSPRTDTTVLSVAPLTNTAVAAAMLDDTRLAILGCLREPASAAAVAAQLGAPRQRIGYHVRALERAGLVSPVRERAHGGLVERVLQASAASYVVAPQVLGPLAADPAAITDRFSMAYQLAVASRILRDLAELRGRAERANKTVPTLTLDTRVRLPSADAQHAFATELANAVARVIEKYHDDESPKGRTFACAVTLHPAVATTNPNEPSPEAGAPV